MAGETVVSVPPKIPFPGKVNPHTHHVSLSCSLALDGMDSARCVPLPAQERPMPLVDYMSIVVMLGIS